MARRMMSRFGQWSSYVFAVEVDTKSDPLYFALGGKHSDGPQVFTNVLADERCYSLHVYSDDKIERAKFYGGLKNKLSKGLPSECTLWEMSAFQPNVKGSLIKGYFLKDSSKSSATGRVLGELLRNDPVYVCSYLCGGEDRQWSQHLWSNAEDGWEKYCVVPAEKPEHHPSTLNIINYDVFYSFEEACKVLQQVNVHAVNCGQHIYHCIQSEPLNKQEEDSITQCGDIIPESKAVLELVEQRLKSEEKTAFPVIVVEGLDATGKTTLTESLTKALGATLLRSPPQCLSPWRARFDTEPPLIRRAFYALGNYLTAGQIGQEARQAPVIVDRYWHSTAAYAIATAVGGKLGNLPKAGSKEYDWPGDLLRPSLVLLLSLSPQERMRRLQVRGQDKTMEEEVLETNHLFRQKVEEAYQRIEGPACITVDASPSPDQVLQQVLLLIREKCHL